ncbi:DUF805 domain-containing protein [Acinetobacter sp. TR11]|uniref:DUF805 domain-containing protein n=1 Tax=Acinetobacter sp. TR11 TaxID=3003393 RepID=UPI0022ABEB16|nr:DUF805 domain-containing protein [Acinetobacter sp. TR11]WAU73784.1 DUF805 domain-containing protein [Acinetobacter sp. TR11]
MNSSIQQTIADNPLRPLGRFSRLSYLGWSFMMTLIFLIIAIIPLIFSASLLDKNTSEGANTVSIIFILTLSLITLTFYYLSIVFMIRRLHDCNRSAWLALLIIVPVINLFFILYLLCAKGTEGPNNFGPVRETKGWEKVLGLISAVLLPLSMVANILMWMASMSAPH